MVCFLHQPAAKNGGSLARFVADRIGHAIHIEDDPSASRRFPHVQDIHSPTVLVDMVTLALGYFWHDQRVNPLPFTEEVEMTQVKAEGRFFRFPSPVGRKPLVVPGHARPVLFPAQPCRPCMIIFFRSARFEMFRDGFDHSLCVAFTAGCVEFSPEGIVFVSRFFQPVDLPVLHQRKVVQYGLVAVDKATCNIVRNIFTLHAICKQIPHRVFFHFLLRGSECCSKSHYQIVCMFRFGFKNGRQCLV